MKIKVLLIDDEPLAFEVIEHFFMNFKDFEIVGKFINPLLALDFLKNNKVDVIFLDINLPHISGMEMISFFNTNQKVIVTTAFREFAAECYDLDVFDYLVKPIALPRFMKSINKLSEELRIKSLKKGDLNQNSGHIFIKMDKKIIKVHFEDILFIEGMKEYIKIVTKDTTLITHKTLTSILDELPSDNFIRIHKSYIVSLDKVNLIEGNTLQISSYKIPIGRLFNKEVRSLILE